MKIKGILFAILILVGIFMLFPALQKGIVNNYSGTAIQGAPYTLGVTIDGDRFAANSEVKTYCSAHPGGLFEYYARMTVDGAQVAKTPNMQYRCGWLGSIEVVQFTYAFTQAKSYDVKFEMVSVSTGAVVQSDSWPVTIESRTTAECTLATQARCMAGNANVIEKCSVSNQAYTIRSYCTGGSYCTGSAPNAACAAVCSSEIECYGTASYYSCVNGNMDYIHLLQVPSDKICMNGALENLKKQCSDGSWILKDDTCPTTPTPTPTPTPSPCSTNGVPDQKASGCTLSEWCKIYPNDKQCTTQIPLAYWLIGAGVLGLVVAYGGSMLLRRR